MTTNSSWWAEFERNEARDMERRENARARLAEWRQKYPVLPLKPELTAPLPEIFDTGKVRLGSGSITAEFPPLTAKVA